MIITVVIVLCTIALIVCLAGLFVSSYMLSKNSHVYNYRASLIKKIDAASSNDIDEGRDYKWRWDVFDSVKYDEMMSLRNIFKSPESFYPDQTFTEVNGRDARRDSSVN